MQRMSRTAERQAWTNYVEAGAYLDTPSTPSRPREIHFMVECRPVPQGSMKGAAITRDDGTPGTVFMCDNKRTHVYRREVGFDALRARALLGVHDVFAPAGPLRLNCTFVFKKPRSAPADRARPIVKPDLDKLMRACCDALSGVLWKDDAQVCEATIAKIYGDVECVHISVQMIEN